MPTHSLKARALILCLLLAIAGTASLYAGGQKESSIDQARTLIANKDYVGAANLLAAIQNNHPELRDQVQPLLAQIFDIKNRYNTVLEKLLAAQDAGDGDTMQKLMAEAQQIDPQAATGLSRSISTRVGVLNLMNQAADLLAAGKPREALSRYLLPIQDPRGAGLDLQKPEFDAAGYGALVTASVTDSASRLSASAEREVSGADDTAGVQASVESLLSATLSAASSAAFDGAIAPLLRAATDEGRVMAASAALSVLNKSLAEGKGAPAPYLDYLVWLSTGREKRTEGMAEAIRQVWQERAVAVLGAAMAKAVTAHQSAVSRYQAGGLADADAAFTESRYAALIAVKAAALVAAGLAPQTSTGVLDAASWQVAAADTGLARTLAADAEAAQAHAAESDGYLALIAERTSVEALPAPATLTAAQAAQARQDILGRLAAAASAQQQWKARSDALAPLSVAGAVTADISVGATKVSEAWAAHQDELRAVDGKLGTHQAALEADAFAASFEAAVTQREKAQDLANATVDGVQSDTALHKPSDALPLYSSAADSLSAVAQDIAAFKTRWQAERPWVLGDPGFVALMSSTDALAAQVTAEAGEISRLSTVAQAQRANGLGKRKEADAFYTAAVNALAQKSYDSATTNFRSASVSYLDSLQFEDDPVATARYNTDIPAALRKIEGANRAQKLLDVDSQIAVGRTQFNNGDFLKAYNTLQGALLSWRDLQGGDEANPGLDSLLEQVRGALDVSGGRDLDQSDSRAPAVNAFVSAANNQVTQADGLPKTSPQRAQLLNDALVNVQRALAIVPVYRAAKALQLKIRKALAPTDAEFNAAADTEIGAILADLKSGALTPDRAYFQLKDYYDVRPNYPGLKDLLGQMEVNLGFKSAPISAADLAESDRQYRLALDASRAGTPDLAAALRILNTAIRLNPDNGPALSLRRSVLLRVGSQQVTALAGTDLLDFIKARRAMGNQDFASAFPILQDLMTRNGGRLKTYPPLAAAYQLARQAVGQ